MFKEKMTLADTPQSEVPRNISLANEIFDQALADLVSTARKEIITELIRKSLEIDTHAVVRLQDQLQNTQERLEIEKANVSEYQKMIKHVEELLSQAR